MALADSSRRGNAREKAETAVTAGAGRVLKTVVNALNEGNSTEAVRLLNDGIAHGIAPDAPKLLDWLARNIGKEAAARLVTAFAAHPCLYCKKGLEHCEACDGHGRRNDGTLCERCLTIGLARCDFCDGAGFLQYIAIPAGLRMAVALERIRLAGGRLAALLKQPAPRADPDDPQGAMKEAARGLLELNRELGILENAYTAAREAARSRTGPKELPAKIVATAIRYAIAGFKRMHRLLECMALCAENELHATDLSASARELAKARSRFFRQLLKPGSAFAGTCLEHSLLQKAIRKASMKRE